MPTKSEGIPVAAPAGELDRMIAAVNEELDRLACEAPKIALEHYKEKGFIGFGSNVVIDAVNRILGVANWKYTHEIIPDTHNVTILVGISLRDPVSGEWLEPRFQYGEANKFVGLKGALTNGLGKTFSEWGIGRSAYLGLLEPSGNWTSAKILPFAEANERRDDIPQADEPDEPRSPNGNGQANRTAPPPAAEPAPDDVRGQIAALFDEEAYNWAMANAELIKARGDKEKLQANARRVFMSRTVEAVAEEIGLEVKTTLPKDFLADHAAALGWIDQRGERKPVVALSQMEDADLEAILAKLREE